MFISIISPYFPYSIVVPLNFPFKSCRSVRDVTKIFQKLNTKYENYKKSFSKKQKLNNIIINSCWNLSVDLIIVMMLKSFKLQKKK